MVEKNSFIRLFPPIKRVHRAAREEATGAGGEKKVLTGFLEPVRT